MVNGGTNMADLRKISGPQQFMVQWSIAAFLLIVAAGAFLSLYAKAIRSPDIPFLQIDSRANWILHRPTPSITPRGGPLVNLSTEFVRDFQITDVPKEVYVYFKAFKKCRVWVNNNLVLPDEAIEANWKRIHALEISQFLEEGTNVIKAKVTCDYGPPALWMYSCGLRDDFRTDTSWQVSTLDSPLKQASAANDSLVHPISLKAVRPFDALVNKLPVLTVFFVISAGLFCLHNYINKNSTAGLGMKLKFFSFTPKGVLMLSIVLWIILFINNTPKLPIRLGFDTNGHLQYVQYLLTNHGIPLASDSWQSYQPPLFYFASALVLAFSRLFFTEQYALYSLKLIPFLCGIGQILAAYYAARLIFPHSKTKQALSTAMAALIPMNIYMSHYISNEPLCAVLMGVSILIAVKILKRQEPSLKLFCILGLVSGLALLSKFTVLAILPVIWLIVFYKLALEQKNSLNKLGKCFGSMLLIMIIAAGWFYIRNWIHFGKPLVGNWDVASGINWWQDPGFHTYKYFCQFGKVFSLPYFSGFYSLFDSLYSTFWGDGLFAGQAEYIYRPPWNYEYISVAYLLAIPAALTIIVGTIGALAKVILRGSKVWLLMSGTVFALGYSIIYMNLRLPFYGQAKAFYALAAVLPISLTFALGFEYVDKRLKDKGFFFLRAILYGWFGTLVSVIFMAFFSQTTT